MASLPICVEDVLTYNTFGNSDAGTGSGASGGRRQRGAIDRGQDYISRSVETGGQNDSTRRPIKRVRIMTRRRPIPRREQVLDEVERFNRRTISVCLSNADDEDFQPEGNPVQDSDEDSNDHGGRGDREGDHTISNSETIIHIIKGNIGMGILTLPMAIRNSGLIGGVIGLGAIAAICIYCMTILVRAAHKALLSRQGVKFLDYADTARASFLDAGGVWAKSASGFRRLLNIFLCASQISSNAVYALFMAQNIKPIMAHYGGRYMEDLNYRYYILMLLPPTLALCMVRNLRYLSPFSVFANIIQSIGLGIIFYYIFATPLPRSDTVAWFAEADRLPLFFGTAIFAIEGISVVLPIENQMRTPGDMLGFNGVLNTSMVMVISLYIAMGFYGYLKYGTNIAASITLNLPLAEIAAQTCLAMFAMSVFFSYALQFYVVMEIVGPNVLKRKVPENWYNLSEYATRIVLNIFTFALAATVPWLDLFVSLLGAVKMSTLSIMAPALIDTASNWDDLGRFKWRLVRNGLLFAFGAFGCIMGTTISLQKIINNFVNGTAT